MALGANTKSEYCPYEKNCPNGCPCSDYDCERGLASSAGIFALGIHPDYTTSSSFIITSVENDTVIPAQIFKLETGESWQKNMCSQIYGSMHFVFEAIVNFEVTDDEYGYRITNQVKIYVVDEVFGVIKEVIKDVKDSFAFNGMSTCGIGFFAEIDGKREDYIYLCTPISDQALVCEQGR